MIVRTIRRVLLLTAALLLPVTASAGPISTGTWTSIALAFDGTAPFWGGTSWDCAACGVGDVLAPYGPLEYLSDDDKAVAFTFSDPVISWTLVSSQTAWTGGILNYANGVFSYNNLRTPVTNSVDHYGQFALFRQVTPALTRYFLGIEDIPLSASQNDLDYNDYVVSFSVPTTTTHTVPEPSTLLLMGTAMAGLARRFRRRREQA
jgi:hypothetical protein